MAQHDYNIANQSGASFRQDLNNALSAIVTLNSGAASPSTTFAYQLWADTTAGTLKIRNAANNAWITLAELDGTLTMETGSAGSPGLYFRGDTNTGFFSANADELAIATGGIQRLMIDSSGRVLLGPGTAGRAVGGAVVAQLGIETLGQAMSLVRNSADTSGAIIALGKSRAATAGGITAVADGDILGELRFCGANGTDLANIGAHIRAIVDGEVGTAGDTTDLPTRLAFSTTPDGEATAAERLRISPSGTIFCGNGETAASPTNSTIAGTGGSGTNITGATLTIQGGRGTGTGAGGPIVFSTAAAGSTGATLNAASERARFDSSGKLLVGTTTSLATDGKLQIKDGGIVVYHASSTAGAGYYINFQTDGGATARNHGQIQLVQTAGNGGELLFKTTDDGASGLTTRMNISNAGLFLFGQVSGAGTNALKYNTGTGAVTYDTSSRLIKENIETCPYGIAEIKQLQPRKYFRTDDQKDEIGFIADEMVDILPEFVPLAKKSTLTHNEEDTEVIPIAVNYEKLTAVLTKAFQEAVERIETLEAKVAALEAA